MIVEMCLDQAPMWKVSHATNLVIACHLQTGAHQHSPRSDPLIDVTALNRMLAITRVLQASLSTYEAHRNNLSHNTCM